MNHRVDYHEGRILWIIQRVGLAVGRSGEFRPACAGGVPVCADQSDGVLLVIRELDDALGLSDLAATALRDTLRGKNTIHRLDGLIRQSVFGRLAGYEDVNNAHRLASDRLQATLTPDGTPLGECR